MTTEDRAGVARLAMTDRSIHRFQWAARNPARQASSTDMLSLSLRFMSDPQLAGPGKDGDGIQAGAIAPASPKHASHSHEHLSGSKGTLDTSRSYKGPVLFRTRGQETGGSGGVKHRVAAGLALGTFSLYWATQTVVKSFHYLRRRQLREMMLQTLPVLEEMGVQHWVDFGSLLGLIRNGDLILHDNDVDVVVLNPDWPSLQEKLTARLGKKYKVGAVRPSEDPSVMWLRVYCPLGMMDIYGAHDRGSGNVEIEIGRERLLDLPKSMVLPTRDITFKGVKVPVPGSTTQVLKTRYGETWMIPRYATVFRGSELRPGQ
mmetsp:Transcript_29399/g.52561  ORF Transcript_29399/g.52561 Transcript_29399/m.52561 type:complete len:317 (-) Transcript_29399:450-1400(-)